MPTIVSWPEMQTSWSASTIEPHAAGIERDSLQQVAIVELLG
jgi:hypothetical protein